MVDVATSKHLTKDEQEEFEAVLPAFAEAVKGSQAGYGADFALTFRVEGDAEGYFLTDGRSILGGLKYQSRPLAEALLKEAILNFGR
jgi:hypothetical protein